MTRDPEECELDRLLNCIFHAKVQLTRVKDARIARGVDVGNDIEQTRSVLEHVEAAFMRAHARRCCVLVKEL